MTTQPDTRTALGPLGDLLQELADAYGEEALEAELLKLVQPRRERLKWVRALGPWKSNSPRRWHRENQDGQPAFSVWEYNGQWWRAHTPDTLNPTPYYSARAAMLDEDLDALNEGWLLDGVVPDALPSAVGEEGQREEERPGWLERLAAEGAVIEVDVSALPDLDDFDDDSEGPLIACPSCRGAGSFRVQWDRELLECERCDGSGEVPASTLPAGQREEGRP